jgi:hypothetical protein
MENRHGQYSPESEKPKSTDPPKPREESTGNNPTGEKKIKQGRLTNQPRAVFGNCIVRGLMPSVQQVEEMLAEGSIAPEEAKQEKKRALAREQMYRVNMQFGKVQDMLRDGSNTETEKLRLKKKEKRLKKVWDRLWKKL